MPKAPQTLVREANEADELLISSWRGIKSNELEFGHACCWISEKKLHQYIPSKGSRKGFISFEAYISQRTGGECSDTRMRECMRIYQLTQGDNAIPADVICEIPHKNAVRLATIKKRSPRKLTKALIEKARTEDTLAFAVTAQSVINETLPVEEQEQPWEHLHLRLHPLAVERFKECIEDFKLIPGAVRDGDRSLDLESKAVLAIVAAAREFAKEAIECAKREARQNAPEVTTETEDPAKVQQGDFVAPDAAEKIATALTEKRVITRNPEPETAN